MWKGKEPEMVLSCLWNPGDHLVMGPVVGPVPGCRPTLRLRAWRCWQDSHRHSYLLLTKICRICGEKSRILGGTLPLSLDHCLLMSQCSPALAPWAAGKGRCVGRACQPCGPGLWGHPMGPKEHTYFYFKVTFCQVNAVFLRTVNTSLCSVIK